MFIFRFKKRTPFSSGLLIKTKMRQSTDWLRPEDSGATGQGRQLLWNFELGIYVLQFAVGLCLDLERKY